MQPPQPPTLVKAPANSIFVPNFSTKPQVNQFTDQFAAFLGPKISSMPGQLHLSIPQVLQQQNPAQKNIPRQTQFPNTHLPPNFYPSLNPHVVQPIVIPSHHLVNSQVPIIPPSIAPQKPSLNKTTQNPVCSPQAHPLQRPNAPKLPLNRNPDLNLWHFPQNKPPKVNPLSNNATLFNKFQPKLPTSTANYAINHAISQTTAPQKINSNHAANCSNQVNPFSTATNIDPPFVTPINPPMYGHTAPAPLCWGGQLHPTPPAPAA